MLGSPWLCSGEAISSLVRAVIAPQDRTRLVAEWYGLVAAEPPCSAGPQRIAAAGEARLGPRLEVHLGELMGCGAGGAGAPLQGRGEGREGDVGGQDLEMTAFVEAHQAPAGQDAQALVHDVAADPLSDEKGA